MRVLFVGDVVGKAGRLALKAGLEPVVDREQIDFVIANVENAAGGFGLTIAVMEELDDLGVHVWTSGNHIWDKKEGIPLLDGLPNLLRPANYPEGNPGRGWCVETTATGVKVGVINLQGQALMAPIDNPFHKVDRVLEQMKDKHPDLKLIIVDMHAEATSEKQGMAFFLDGRVTAVLGTHTHVPTADERVLPGGTALQTDVGMTGPYLSVIGMKPEKVLERFLYNTPRPFDPAKKGLEMRGAIVEANEDTGLATSIRRVKVPIG
ncbi:MAG: TIGR00282 family metallophosphoesterase [bacterium]|nr:TIGR00282 family metallophosphoesterase [bacterium]